MNRNGREARVIRRYLGAMLVVLGVAAASYGLLLSRDVPRRHLAIPCACIHAPLNSPAPQVPEAHRPS